MSERMAEEHGGQLDVDEQGGCGDPSGGQHNLGTTDECIPGEAAGTVRQTGVHGGEGACR